MVMESGPKYEWNLHSVRVYGWEHSNRHDLKHIKCLNDYLAHLEDEGWVIHGITHYVAGGEESCVEYVFIDARRIREIPFEMRFRHLFKRTENLFKNSGDTTAKETP